MTASDQIDRIIRELGDRRGATHENVRRLITEADPEMVEEWKWRGTPVWSHGGGATRQMDDVLEPGTEAGTGTLGR